MSEPTYQLVIRRGPQPGYVFQVNAPLMVIGRDPLADIVINDPEISRNHARLTRTPDGYQLQDMGSTNGTFLDGKRLKGEPVMVRPGQTIAMGSGILLIFQATVVGQTPPPPDTVFSHVDHLPEYDVAETDPPPLVDPNFVTFPSADMAAEAERLAAGRPEEPMAAPTPPPLAKPKVDNSTMWYLLLFMALLLLCCICGGSVVGIWYITQMRTMGEVMGIIWLL